MAVDLHSPDFEKKKSIFPILSVFFQFISRKYFKIFQLCAYVCACMGAGVPGV